MQSRSAQTAASHTTLTSRPLRSHSCSVPVSRQNVAAGLQVLKLNKSSRNNESTSKLGIWAGKQEDVDEGDEMEERQAAAIVLRHQRRNWRVFDFQSMYMVNATS